MQIEPYLFFEGRCDEAIEFYTKALGAEVKMLMRYKDSPDPMTHLPGLDDKIMHASLRIGNTTVNMSDGRCEAAPHFQGFALTLSAADPVEAGRFYTALLEGGQVLMPMMQTFYSPSFGMVFDRFGVMWMVIVPA